jgi:hypothetical protein
MVVTKLLKARTANIGFDSGGLCANLELYATIQVSVLVDILCSEPPERKARNC